MNQQILILYLEDALEDAIRAENELRKSGLRFHLQQAISKETFLRGLEPPPDVILSDHGLASFDGITALALAREKCPAVPFIFVTNALSREMEIEKLTGGVADFVRKSQLDYLPVAVRHALHEAEERRLQSQRLKGVLDPAIGATSFLPICSHCKKIRDAQNRWKSPDVFFREYLNLKFTHGICPECAKKFLPEE